MLSALVASCGACSALLLEFVQALPVEVTVPVQVGSKVRVLRDEFRGRAGILGEVTKMEDDTVWLRLEDGDFVSTAVGNVEVVA